VRTVAIRTPDQRLRVFVSSALSELADERRVVARAISALGFTPVMFESGARPHPPKDLYRAYLAQSHVFIGLYWQRYGWIGPGMQISGLEDEFNLSQLLPRLLYVKASTSAREPRLADLISRIEREAADSYRIFRAPAAVPRQLTTQPVPSALTALSREPLCSRFPAECWVTMLNAGMDRRDSSD
jgi:hypothetical protein